jgi:voltage-gated potassium channel
VLAVSALSIVNILLIVLPVWDQIGNVVINVDLCICIILLTDFAFRFHRGGRRYFLHDLGWLDLLGSLTLPGLRLLRVFRMVRVGTALKRRGVRPLIRDFRANLAEGALFMIAFFVIVVLEFGSIAVLIAERGDPKANILTGGDALWWAIVTITTTGYGDLYPVTRGGRVVAVVVLITGVALVGIITGYLANSFINPRKRLAPAVPPEGRGATVAEVRRLIDEQEAALATLRRRIAELEPEPER